MALPASGSTDINDLAPVQCEVRFQASEEFTEKLKQAKKLLSGKFPAGVSLEEVLGECIDVFLDKKCPVRKDKRRRAKAAKVKKPAALPSKPKETTRNIPTAIRDEVYIRDGGKCTYKAPDGTRCCSEHDLEVHHEVPFAVCKSHELENLRLLCRQHNSLLANRDFGAEFVQGRIEWKKSLAH